MDPKEQRFLWRDKDRYLLYTSIEYPIQYNTICRIYIYYILYNIYYRQYIKYIYMSIYLYIYNIYRSIV